MKIYHIPALALLTLLLSGCHTTKVVEVVQPPVVTEVLPVVTEVVPVTKARR